MRAQARMKLWREGSVNGFLLCTVLAKQTRRLGRLMPDRRIPELITIALKNCADYELALDVDAGVPEVVREEAMQIGRLTRRPEPAVASRALAQGTGVRVHMQFRPAVGKARQKVSPQTKHPFWAKVRLALAVLWAVVSILLIFAAIYIAFKGKIR